MHRRNRRQGRFAVGPAAGIAAAILFPGPAAASWSEVASLCLAGSAPVEPRTVWTAWSLAPETVLPLALLLLLCPPARRAASDRGAAASFLAGWLLLVLALVSPLCRMAASLASAHMVQHVILVALAPPLLAIGAAARRPHARRPPGRFASYLRAPVTVSALYAGAIWLAHVPRVYQAALTDPAVHLLLVALLLAVGYLFWTTLIRGSAAGGILMAFAALVQTGLLGALLTFAPTPWYPVFASRAAPWGLTPLEDQQLAGLIMWVPMGAVYLAAGLAALARLLARLDVAVPR